MYLYYLYFENSDCFNNYFHYTYFVCTRRTFLKHLNYYYKIVKYKTVSRSLYLPKYQSKNLFVGARRRGRRVIGLSEFLICAPLSIEVRKCRLNILNHVVLFPWKNFSECSFINCPFFICLCYDLERLQLQKNKIFCWMTSVFQISKSLTPLKAFIKKCKLG